jgi:hypothetical protein
MIPLEVVDKNFNTNRQDNWWFEPTVFAIAFITFAIYSLSVVLFDFDAGRAASAPNLAGTHYNSPFYGPDPGFIFPFGLPFAFFTLWAPFGFRGTCYYMRRVYYRSIFPVITTHGPPACAVDGMKAFKGKYKGENAFPWILNNFHRYFLYAAMLLAIFHWYEAFNSTRFTEGIGIGIGTMLAFIDAVFLTLYIITCHAFRHLFGGGVDRQGSFTNKIWSKISKLNVHHGKFFWASLISIWAWDLYIRLLSYGIVSDYRVIF